MDVSEKMVCPNCGSELNLDELYMAQIAKRYEEKSNKVLQDTIRHKDEETEKKMAEAVKKATAQQGKQIKDLMEKIQYLTEVNQKATKEMQKMMNDQLELQQKLQNAQLVAQKQLSEKADEIYHKAKKESDEANEAKIASLKKQLKDANNATEEVKRKLSQGSQQLQGEIQELQLEDCLRTEFPLDKIVEVEKGKLGADIIQTVVSRGGKACGTIVWESKNVKTWKNDFIPKLREDMERVNGDVGILVSAVFGSNMVEFTNQDGVWLIKPKNAISIARIIRDGLIKASQAMSVAEHKETMQGAIYEFVTSSAFRNRIENIGRQYRALDNEISRTKISMDRHWETQRKMIDNLVENTQSILGDVDAYLLQADSENIAMIESPDYGCNLEQL